MKNLSVRAKAYIAAVIALGASIFAWSFTALPVESSVWAIFGILVICGATAQMFTVFSPKNQAYEITPVFIFTALLLLPPAPLAWMILLCYVPEWIRSRRIWYVQLFNISIGLIEAFAARLFYLRSASSSDGWLVSAPTIVWMVAAAAAFTVLNHFLLAVVLRLARGHSWRETRLFEIGYFFTDAALACTGIIAAYLWQMSEWLIPLALAPLFLIYRALNTANLQEQASTDPKTGLYNTRHFNQAMREEMRRAERFGRPLSIIMADMDLLRNINNSFGHLAGDLALKGTADIIHANMREYDVASRFGGEEFAIMLPETDAEQALAVAERIRKQVEVTCFSVSTSVKPIEVTISLGVASYPAHGMDANEVIHQADLAVYYAKLCGRNRTWASSPESQALGPVMAAHLDPSASTSVSADTSRGVPPELRRVTNLQAARKDGHYRLEASAQPFERSDGSKVAPEPVVTGAFTAAHSQDREERIQVVEDTRDGHEKVNWPVALFIATVTVAVLALWAAHRPWAVPLDWLGIIALGCLTAGAQCLAIDTFGRGRVSTSAVLILAGGILFGLAGALLIAPVVPLAAWIRNRGFLHRALFDLGNITLSGALAASVYSRLAVEISAPEIAVLVVSAGVASLAYYVVNVGLTSVVIGLSERESPLEVWREKFSWLLLHYAVFGLLAVLIVLAYRALGITGLLALFVPPMMMPYVMKQYTERTQANVAEVKRVNDQLVAAHQEVVAAHQEVLNTYNEMRATYDATLVALSTALDSRDTETVGHSQRVVSYVSAIAGQLGLIDDELPGLLNGALLHDVGKIGVPDAILRKQGPLTMDEWAIMRRHPEDGYRMLRHIGFLSNALPVVLHHHERYDGTGYPDGLTGEEIPLAARIFAVADAFDAMTSQRPYRRAHSVESARLELRRCSGTQFDPEVVDAFVRVDVRELARISGQPIEEPEPVMEDGAAQVIRFPIAALT